MQDEVFWNPAIDLPMLKIISFENTGTTLVLTTVDLSKLEGQFKIFQTLQEAKSFVHDISKLQFPDYHKNRCAVCKNESKE